MGMEEKKNKLFQILFSLSYSLIMEANSTTFHFIGKWSIVPRLVGSKVGMIYWIQVDIFNVFISVCCFDHLSKCCKMHVTSLK